MGGGKDLPFLGLNGYEARPCSALYCFHYSIKVALQVTESWAGVWERSLGLVDFLYGI